MTTRIDSELKREIMIGGTAYTLTLTPDKLVLALKGRRKGLEIKMAGPRQRRGGACDGAQCVAHRKYRAAPQSGPCRGESQAAEGVTAEVTANSRVSVL